MFFSVNKFRLGSMGYLREFQLNQNMYLHLQYSHYAIIPSPTYVANTCFKAITSVENYAILQHFVRFLTYLYTCVIEIVSNSYNMEDPVFLSIKAVFSEENYVPPTIFLCQLH